MKKASERISETAADSPGTGDPRVSEIAQRSSLKRPPPVELLASTARIPKADLDTILRSESGTRPVVTREEIARHIEENLGGAWAGANAAEIMVDVGDPGRAFEDAHSRPTIDVFPSIPIHVLSPSESDKPNLPIAERAPSSITTPAPMTLTPTPGSSPLSPYSLPTPTSFAPPSSATPSSPVTPRWLAPVAIASILVLISLTLAFGFVLGRVTGHH